MTLAKRLFVSAGLTGLALPGIIALHLGNWAAAGLGFLAGLIAVVIIPDQ